MPRRSALAALAVVAVALVPVGGSAAPPKTADSYRVVAAKRIARGVTHFRLVSPNQRINIARISPDAPVRPVVAVAKSGIGPARGKQRTSGICARHDCLAGVNGDFFYTDGRPAGAVVVNGEPWITRRYDRPHLIIGKDGSFSTGRVEIPIQILVRHKHALEPIDETLGSDTFTDLESTIGATALNDTRGADELVIFTPRRGPKTGTGQKGVEIIAEIVSSPKRLLVGSSVRIKLRKLVERGNAAIPPDGLVLSGRGEPAKALRALWDDVRSGSARSNIRIRVRGPGQAHQVIGGRPVLVRDGKVLEQPGTWFSRAPHARTIAGWSKDGTMYLVTIDRGAGARGMSLTEAARFMKRLGVWGAINLDGGGSTTFVRKGNVRNRPQHGSERAVGSSLVIVRERS